MDDLTSLLIAEKGIITFPSSSLYLNGVKAIDYHATMLGTNKRPIEGSAKSIGAALNNIEQRLGITPAQYEQFAALTAGLRDFDLTIRVYSASEDILAGIVAIDHDIQPQKTIVEALRALERDPFTAFFDLHNVGRVQYPSSTIRFPKPITGAEMKTRITV